MKLDLSSLEDSVAILGNSVAAVAAHAAAIPADLRETLRSGVIQNFKVTYEQAWKTMRRWIEVNVGADVVDGVTRRELFRLAAENRLIDEVDRWMRFHAMRNLTTHTYNQETADEVEAAAQAFVTSAQAFLAALRSRND